MPYFKVLPTGDNATNRYFVTLVTACFSVGVENSSDYILQIRHTLALMDAMVIFTSPDLVEIIRSHRSHVPHKTHIIPMHLNETLMATRYGMEFWLNSTMTHEEPSHRTNERYILWHEKPNWVQRAMQINPFQSKLFAWMDANYLNNSDYDHHVFMQRFPNPERFHSNQIFSHIIYMH